MFLSYISSQQGFKEKGKWRKGKEEKPTAKLNSEDEMNTDSTRLQKQENIMTMNTQPDIWDNNNDIMKTVCLLKRLMSKERKPPNQHPPPFRRLIAHEPPATPLPYITG